ncbi:methionine-tRNA ligase, beta subunit [Cryptococcus deuterogattii 99/473]|uniref:Methionine-tRNA ligase, beta subunit n=1 Tax=Cryptococcus deuterogattii Ram5 TaxID=1296110 RepID=A0A0D0T3N1_9TREE|nr:methionine-tRNA ligase, beta subunit [Cryptococcus deuterogattii Ram5]KIR99903.1 methionine-tRNA ligase, beta subunit [Cryptococcus deuterogattii 2001/935-1]KIY58603.1 methionine-tRNA ligase, beta subunit [Cryptococcus deuterogattii 99/473]
MSSQVQQFISAAVNADPSLAGQNDKDEAAIEKLVGESEGLAKDLPALNEKLTPLTYLYSNYPSTADINAPATQHPTLPAVLRYFLHIQSLPSVSSARSELPNAYPTLEIDLSTLPAPERKAPAPKVKKEKKAAAPAAESVPAAEGAAASVAGAVSAATGAVIEAATNAAETVKDAVVGKSEKDAKKKEKKEKKEKPAKAPKPAAEVTGPMPSMIDMRVGKVLDVKRHPDADSLYVETIDVGEPEPRTVCSGLVKYMSEDEIRGATVVVICNLKPVTMRGVKSFAMLLCASSKDGKEEGGVQFVLPPEGSQPGERIYFEGEKYENATPEPQLNPKKKVFETIQPNFITLENREAAWIDPETKSVHRIRTKDGVLKSQSFVGASLS